LKRVLSLDIEAITASPPARGRGLKPSHSSAYKFNAVVAPRAGAWIETLFHRNAGLFQTVAPRAGAWIETQMISKGKVSAEGRPPRGGVD